jgi:hypothetical protein
MNGPGQPLRSFSWTVTSKYPSCRQLFSSEVRNKAGVPVQFFFNFPLYLQSVPIHSAHVVKSCKEARRRVLTSTLLYLIESESSCDLGSETYKTIFTVNSIYILNLVGRSFAIALFLVVHVILKLGVSCNGSCKG